MKETKPGLMVFEGVPVFVPNSTLSPDDGSFHVSHNNQDQDWYGGETTALVGRVKVKGLPGEGVMEAFYILNGDHREAYRELIPQGWGACHAYYEAHPDQHNLRTDTTETLESLAKSIYPNG